MLFKQFEFERDRIIWKVSKIKAGGKIVMVKLGYLGPKGTFSHEALKVYKNILERKYSEEVFVKDNKKYCEQAYTSIRDLLFDVEYSKIDEAVVPLENSLEGSVNETLDILANEVDLKCKAEVIIRIRQNLLIKKGGKSDKIKYIVSHPQAIGQCKKYISDNFNDAEIKLVYSTAGAAEFVANSKGGFAAIGSSIAAEEYGLDIYAKDIQDGENNFTRFVIISKNDSQKTGSDKTSIVFSTENKPGSLYRVLDIFSLWDINMTRIESRPAKKSLGSYIFFVDIEGHRNDEDVHDALTMVRKKTSFYKFLGSYPKYKF